MKPPAGRMHKSARAKAKELEEQITKLPITAEARTAVLISLHKLCSFYEDATDEATHEERKSARNKADFDATLKARR